MSEIDSEAGLIAVRDFYDAVKGYSFPEGHEVIVRIHDSGWDVYDPTRTTAAAKRLAALEEALRGVLPFVNGPLGREDSQVAAMEITDTPIREAVNRARAALADGGSNADPS